MGRCALEGLKDVYRGLRLYFAPRGEDRNTSVTFNMNSASKRSKRSPCTMVFLTCFRAKTKLDMEVLYDPPRADGTRRALCVEV